MITFLYAIPLLFSAAFSQDQPTDAETVPNGKLDIQWMLPGQVTKTTGLRLVCVSPDGKHFASAGGADSTVKLWDAAKRCVERSFVLYPKQEIVSLDYSTDGGMLLVAGTQYTAILDAQSLKPIKKYLFTDLWGMVFVNNNQSLMGCRTRNIHDRDRGTLMIRAPFSTDFELQYSPLALIDQSRSIAPIWHLANKKVFIGDEPQIFATYIDFINNQSLETYPAEVKQDGRSLWSGESLDSEFRKLATPANALLPSGDLLFCSTGSRPGRNDTLYRQIVKHDFSGYTELPPIAFPPGSGMALTRITKSATGESMILSLGQKFTKSASGFWHILFDGGQSQVGEPFLTKGRIQGIGAARTKAYILHGEITEFDLTEGRNYSLTEQNAFITGLYYKGGGPLAAASMDDGSVHVWNPSNPDESFRFSAPTIFQPKVNNKLMSPAILTDLAVWKSLVIGGTVGPSIFVLDAKTGKQIRKITVDPETGHGDWPMIRYVGGGSQMLVATPLSTKGLQLLDTETGKVVRRFLPSSPASMIEASERYVAALSDQKLRVWEIMTAKLVYEGDPPTKTMTKMAINDSLKILAVGTSDDGAAAYDLLTGKLKHRFKGTAGSVLAMAATKDNRLITICDDDSEPFPLRVWDIATGRQLKQFAEEVGPCSFGSQAVYDDKTGILVFSRGDATIIGTKID